MGTINSEKIVPKVKPITIIQAISLWEFSEIPVLKNNGIAPSIIVAVVIRIGLNLTVAAFVTASVTDLDSSKRLFANFVISIPCLDINPARVSIPIILNRSRVGWKFGVFIMNSIPHNAQITLKGTVKRIINGSL